MKDTAELRRVHQRLFLKPPAVGTHPRPVVEPPSWALKPNQHSDRHVLLCQAVVTSAGWSGWMVGCSPSHHIRLYHTSTQCSAQVASQPGGCSAGIPNILWVLPDQCSKWQATPLQLQHTVTA
eukprot:2990421-Rhodomonas_salina.2